MSGWDRPEVFYTDEHLAASGISFSTEDDCPIDQDAKVIWSTAYKASSCSILKRALESRECFSYPQLLAALSQQGQTYAVAGTHGKTTSVAACSWVFSSGPRASFPIGSIFGSFLQGQGALCHGTENLILEACEYQDHFLAYKLRGALVTSIDFDHPDFFESLEDVMQSFKRFAQGLGFLVYCADDDNARKLGQYARKLGIMSIGYGFSARGPFHVTQAQDSSIALDLIPYMSFRLPFASKALLNDLVGSAILSAMLLLDRPQPKLYLQEGSLVSDEALATEIADMLKTLETYPGCTGRCETLLVEKGVTYIDDYAHHPSEIKVSLSNIRALHPGCRLVVAFKSHTASRTRAFLEDFASSLSLADRLVISPVYSSARQDGSHGEDEKLARELCDLITRRYLYSYTSKLESCVYASDSQAAAVLASALEEGCVCVTLGAANNRGLCRQAALLRRDK